MKWILCTCEVVHLSVQVAGGNQQIGIRLAIPLKMETVAIDGKYAILAGTVLWFINFKHCLQKGKKQIGSPTTHCFKAPRPTFLMKLGETKSYVPFITVCFKKSSATLQVTMSMLKFGVNVAKKYVILGVQTAKIAKSTKTAKIRLRENKCIYSIIYY